ncbi:transmembrane sensor [Parabacteroides sp. PF5-5]|uniref:FecR family protein n=1 Tax=unclassified Parabacteroides TaxID=2649774 RepID=UPI0024732681|nr:MULTISPECIES: FecR domain-containing protein [unclassified Parabacteroides]MDH6303646.1 transmembrane sensor [Parabacteroides sp. PH5-39]MDH6314968.1 transmembrane sensor [Parabacteroides sp. PF5-13]MDH6318305.1 transmembrane sensor [Parabacteroides sp. PH5-13]MDH6321762.1 transmembrane sensor [Parabacteroides sp. PH5-8]MDH6325886.1 transmembrane sensor [Parabacteroides sp. PH5-41]
MDEEVLLRFLTKECTSEDLQMISQWVTTKPENTRWLFEMEEVWSLKHELKYSDKEEIKKAYQAFLKKTEQIQKRRVNRMKRFRIYASAAAAAVILVFLSISVFRSVYTETIRQNLSENIDVNEIDVPNGQSITVKLSDGTLVWLNSGSKLIYPAKFSAKNRIVKLMGEGLFEVEHDKRSPFVVMSGSVSTKVLGTKFNVKAYQNETIRISLLEGIIEVLTNENEEAVRLSEPDQQVEIFMNGQVKKTNADAFAISQWTKGELYFDNESLENIVASLERKYNIKITIRNDSYKSMTFHSRIQKDASLENILNVLKGTRNIDYSIDKEGVSIY